jgi:hypothetical protein
MIRITLVEPGAGLSVPIGLLRELLVILQEHSSFDITITIE